MIKRLDRHITTTVISSTMVVLFALLSIDLLAQIISEADILGKKNYTFSYLMAYVFGLVPLRIMLFFPISLLIGALVGMGKMAAANELTVMQTSGISRLRIALLGFSVAFSMGVGVLLMTEFIGVDLSKKVIQMRAERLGESLYNHHNGVWVQDKNSFINIKGVNPNGSLDNITIYRLDKDMQFKQIITAQTAVFRPGEWALQTVVVKHIKPDGIVLTHHKKWSWKNTLNADVLSLLLKNPEDLSLRDLYRYIRYQKANHISAMTYALIFWQHLLVPLSTGVMFLLALPFAFGSQRSGGQGRRLLLGVLLGVSYFIVSKSIANLFLLTGASALLGAILPIVLFFLIGLSLLWLRR